MFEMDQLKCESELNAKWVNRAKEIPYLQFPAEWYVKVIPPFHGAYARFRVSLSSNPEEPSISIYLDFDDRLGCVGQPYWEIYPNCNDDCDRHLIDDTDDLIEGIGNALECLYNKDSKDE